MAKDGFLAYKEWDDKIPFYPEGVSERWIDRPGTAKVMQLVDPETGEVTVVTKAPDKIKVDHDPIQYGKVIRVKDISFLSGGAKLILLYAAYHIKINTISINLHWLTVGRWCGFSRHTFYKCVKELLDADILAIKLKKDNSYYVNPNYVFNGNRTKI